MPRKPNESDTDIWRRLWESNQKSHRQLARVWLQQLSDSPWPPEGPTVPFPAPDSSDIDAMASNPVIQSLEDQFLHWRQDMEKKQEGQARQMKELQDNAEQLQCENDRLRA